MRSDLAGQAQQLHRPVQRQFAIGQILGNGPALGLLALSHLDIGAEPPGFPADILSGLRMLAQHYRPALLGPVLAARLPELARIFARLEERSVGTGVDSKVIHGGVAYN